MLAVRSWDFMVILLAIGSMTFVCICALAYWLIWEIGKAKSSMDVIRSMHADRTFKEDIKKGLNKVIDEYKKDKEDKKEKSWYLWPWKVAAHSSDDLDSNPKSAS
jgi:hypothetical protein